MPTAAAPTLSDEDIAELIDLLGDADSVELKLSVPERQQRSAVAALGLDPLDAQVRLVHFFDTPGPGARARPGSSCAPGASRARATTRWSSCGRSSRRSCRRTCAGRRASSSRSTRCRAASSARASLKGVPKAPGVRETLLAGRPLRKLFSKEQRAFYAEHAPDGHRARRPRRCSGPIFVLKLKGIPPGYGRKLVVELWLYPDGSRILELSTKCATDEMFQVAVETRAFLVERGRRAVGRAADQDAQGARVLLRARGLSRGARGGVGYRLAS